jgi:hypothetical protein
MIRTLMSEILVKSLQRLSGCQYIAPTLMLKNEISLEAFAAQTLALQAKIDAHNGLVADVNAKLAASRAEIREMEQALSPISEWVLRTIAALYGKDSNEYAMVGGTRQSATKPKSAKPKPETTPVPNPEAAPENSLIQSTGVANTELILESIPIEIKRQALNSKKLRNGNVKAAIG